MNSVIEVLFELSVNLLEGFIMIEFVSNFLGYRYLGQRRIFGFILGIALNFCYVTLMNSLTVFEGVGVLISVILLFVYCIFFTKGTLLTKLFVSAITFVMIIVVNMIILTSVNFITQTDITTLMGVSSAARYITVILTKIVFFFITRIMLVFNNKARFSLSRIEWLAIIAITLISIFISAFIAEISVIFPNSELTNAFVLSTMLGIVVINIITYYLLLKLSTDNIQRLQYIMLEKEYNYQKKHIADVKTLYNDISKARHDMKNHFICIMGMIEQSRNQQALQYITKILEQKIDSGVRYVDTTSETANYLINSKLQVTQELGIDTKCYITGDLTKIPEMDICVLLGNILDNAIEGCQSYEHPMITIDIHNNKGYLQILVGNTISQSVLERNPKLFSCKQDKKTHGFGVNNIKGVVASYQGIIDYYEKDGFFYCDVMI